MVIYNITKHDSVYKIQYYYLSITVWEDTFQMKISPLILADAMKFPQGDQETIDTN